MHSSGAFTRKLGFMKCTERIQNLIAYRILHGNDLNEAEKAELEEWLKAGDENRAFYYKLMDSQNWTAWVEKRRLIRFEPYWEHVAKHTVHASRRISRLRLLTVAASITLLLGIGVSALFFSRSRLQPIDTASLIGPGQSKAYLVFSDGESMTLGNSLPLGKLEKDGALITTDSAGLTYAKERGNDSPEVHHTLIVPKGGEYILTLEDGTIVHLNAQSTLDFPVHFAVDKREVFLQGEAYFRVKHADSLPFIVRTGSMDVHVTGTEFNVRAYSDEPLVQTTLVKGHVDVEANGCKKELLPHQQAELDLLTMKTTVRSIEVEDYIAWTKGEFVFKGQRLEDIVKELARWYDFEVFYQNPEVCDMIFGGKLNREGSIEPILKIMEATLTLNISIKGRTIVFQSN